MVKFLEFEKPIAALQEQIEELEAGARDGPVDVRQEVKRLRKKVDAELRSVYANLSPWQKAMVARHPDRPHFSDILGALFTDFEPLAGDRYFAEDAAIQGGMARFDGKPVMVIGHEKGRDTESRLKHNFGMGKPEGYRKAVRLMEMADRFGFPVLTFVDTAGAFPGIEAEERGAAEALARGTAACLRLGVPMIATITGEGGSGGALALAAANRVLMLEHSFYAVISPEGCASILWRSGDRAQDAAQAMRISAQDLKSLGLVDGVIGEPLGGAHRDPAAAMEAIGAQLRKELKSLEPKSAEELRRLRREKFLAMERAA
ncbi:acetyl-CoA carboxylase carboxyl transferase subunit alpha [Pacificimonas flava]|uniref:Acetyl-coenzyme A carboxylase carboxyl transferase subunit alpha n=2 Tax=Pacificimonas TaxID=1960290 RepID=A0A219B227_9SPHN|nr:MULTISPECIES: acetyl-CoA carboxylase carboxyltransferase subunit alpha [Pacificimonas]MBZ6377971.1 acetyl-CoA carboxylase carboxyltransferase subunit alpha [Pacificimonas aurantium]OWV32380.1 acetyl-CoA carboxylase carboxyl transferase subunit alpha [Pacificimonas flava]